MMDWKPLLAPSSPVYALLTVCLVHLRQLSGSHTESLVLI